MQQIERFIGITKNDIRTIGPDLKAAYSQASHKYLTQTHPKLRLLDNLIMFSLATFFTLVAYGAIFNRDPFNSFIAGVLCSLGTFGLSASLRVQLSGEEFESYPNRKKIVEYCAGCLLLFFASFLLMDDK